MKILLVNNHHKILGGTERYYFNLTALLESKGHEVAHFSMTDKGNINSKWKQYFVSNINLRDNRFQNFIRKIFRMPYSLEAKKKFGNLLDKFNPDIVHLNNIYYYITPSIFSETKKRRIPVVQTVHDYELISPSTTLFYNGQVSELTKKHNYYKALFYRKFKPYFATHMSVITSYIQHIFKFYENNVDLFITPSKFMRQKLIEYDFDPKKIIHLNNFTEIPQRYIFKKSDVKSERYVLYIGRVDEAKGIFILLKIAKLLPNIKFKVAGDFVEKSLQQKILCRIKEECITNIYFLGFLEGKELSRIIQGCEFTIFTSIWYENQPYSILESLSHGKAVVANNIGGIGEIIKDGKNGLLFKHTNINGLNKKIRALWNDKGLIKKMGKNGLKTIIDNYNRDQHYNSLIKLYAKT